MILAGAETGIPADSPVNRLDTRSEFQFVGALSIGIGTSNFKGSAVALSPEWVITAAHNVDLNDDGLKDVGWGASFLIPGRGMFAVTEAIINPGFSGFGNPSVNDDLALLRLATPLPGDLVYPGLGTASVGDFIALVGFGRSGFGDYGYTTRSSLTDRLYGGNVIDSLWPDDEGTGVAEVFRYDFDDYRTAGLPGGSLGNDVETIIGPGDSGGAALHQVGNAWELVGINTFTEGYGGRFGDTGGGVAIGAYQGWILNTTGIPEPGVGLLLMLGFCLRFLLRKRPEIYAPIPAAGNL
jgi:hypothetical protein